MSTKSHEVTRVGPFQDSAESATELTLPFTLFDLIWLKHPIVHSVAFFRLTESTRSVFHSEIVPRLKSSLSRTLVHFLPLAGRIVWDPQEPQPVIRYSPGDGVAFCVSESNADFDYLSGKKERPGSELHSLVPELAVGHEFSPIASLQVTLFPNKGYSLGITLHHAVVDGSSANQFFRAWAHICKHPFNSLPSDLTPSFDRSVIRDPTGLGPMILNGMLTIFRNRKSVKPLRSVDADPDVVQATFVLTREEIGRLRDRVKNELTETENPSGPNQKVQLSSFVITYAHVLTCMVKARGGPVDRPVFLSLAVDFRSRVDPPAPPQYFGNCVAGACNSDVTAGMFLENNGFISAARSVNDLVTGIGPTTLEKMHEFVNVYTRFNPDLQMVSVVGSTRFAVYELDFGWGNPVKVCGVSLEKNGGTVSIAGTKRGDVEVMVSLKRREMEIFATLFADNTRNGVSIRSSL